VGRHGELGLPGQSRASPHRARSRLGGDRGSGAVRRERRADAPRRNLCASSLSALPPGVWPGRNDSPLPTHPSVAAVRLPLAVYLRGRKPSKNSSDAGKHTPAGAERKVFFSARPKRGGARRSDEPPLENPIGERVPGGTLEGSTPPTPHQHPVNTGAFGRRGDGPRGQHGVACGVVALSFARQTLICTSRAITSTPRAGGAAAG
jgi:hypothetical protein